MTSVRNLGDLRLGDLLTFLAVCRTGTVSGAARSMNTTASQVSKAVARLEKQLGRTLLSRGARGVSLTEAGRRVLPAFEGAIGQLRSIAPGPDSEVELTIAAPSYLHLAFLPAIARCAARLRTRAIELSPSMLRAQAAENAFQAALTLEPESLPKSWVSKPVGPLRRALMTTPHVAEKLGPPPVSEDALHGLPFILPIFNVTGSYVAVNDDCPASFERKGGHYSQTIGLALELAARLDHLVFGPVIAARRYIERGELVEVPVRDWATESMLYLACNVDQVLASTQRSMLVELKRAHEEYELSERARSASRGAIKHGRG
jgi:DNA-binding transcriptional LysR family regulator